MQITLDDVLAFVRLAEHRNFNRAAAELYITQPALSRRLKKLEENLGTRLLDRTTRNVHLTVVGTEFLPMAQRMVRDFEKSLSDIVDVIQIRAGVVSISTNMTVADALMPEVLETYRQSHPNIQIRVTEDSSPATVDRILSGEAEFGIAQLGTPRPELEFEPLHEDKFVMVCHMSHPLAGRKSVSWEDLAGHDFVRMRSSSGTWRLMSTALEEKGIAFNVPYEVAHLTALLGLIGQNLGISAIPSLGALKRPDLDLYTCPITDPTVSRTLGIVRLHGRTLSPAAEALASIIRETLQRDLKLPRSRRGPITSSFVNKRPPKSGGSKK